MHWILSIAVIILNLRKFDCFAQNITSRAHIYSTAESATLWQITTQVDTDSEAGNGSVFKIPLYIGAYFSFGGGWDCSGIIVAAQMALDHINAREDILPEYELRMIYNDTQCSSGLGTRVLFDQLFREPRKIALLGDGCSTSTQAIAGTSYHWNLVTMSYSASSPSLSNRVQYPYFYRTIMPDTMFNPARIQLIKYFGWTRVATIHENYEIFSLAIDNLLTLLRKENITVVSSESFAENPHNQVENLKNQDARIIIVNMYQTKARRVFCEAYKQGMTGHVWILLGWYATDWYKAVDNNIDCTVEEMIQFVENSYYLGTETQHLEDLTSEKKTIANITSQEFNILTRERLLRPENRQFSWNNRNPQGYDATWALAMMLNGTSEKLKFNGRYRRLENFTYDDNEMREMFLMELSNLKFDGVSGSVSFLNGDRVDSVRIEQLQKPCDVEWVTSGDFCYKFVASPNTYEQASLNCQSQDSTLLHVYSEEDHWRISTVWEIVEGKYDTVSWLIGLRMNNGQFLWDGSEHALSWQPAGGNITALATVTEQCVYANLKDGVWRTTDCGKQYSFICQKRSGAVERFIALYVPGDSQDGEGHLEWRDEISWPGGVIPLDHTPEVVITYVRIHLGIGASLYIPMCIVAGIAMINACVFLAFNIKYRKQR
ncbi:gamma-aminobutyric acid type B receptor subunit 1-like [Amphiura filiformis]|uniref:gamma-aminobutyric acid type B receptor subunit 1-like n=1 Tax=Amphiura filiformis TaxID=82378 RepID=UPI003B2280C2